MTGIIVLCRFNSSRLPGKILKKIKGKPIIQYIIERLETLKGKYPFVVCTSVEATDDPIIAYCIEHGINYYRGPLDNVALRFLNCAKKFGFKNATRINGDNIFLDSNLIKTMIDEIELNELNFISNVKERTFPRGMSIEIVNTEFYEKVYAFFEEQDFEHVMTYFYRGEFEKRKYVYNSHAHVVEMNLAIDTLEDFKMAEHIIESMDETHTSYDFKEIMNLYLKIK